MMNENRELRETIKELEYKAVSLLELTSCKCEEELNTKSIKYQIRFNNELTMKCLKVSETINRPLIWNQSWFTPSMNVWPMMLYPWQMDKMEADLLYVEYEETMPWAMYNLSCTKNYSEHEELTYTNGGDVDGILSICEQFALKIHCYIIKLWEDEGMNKVQFLMRNEVFGFVKKNGMLSNRLNDKILLMKQSMKNYNVLLLCINRGYKYIHLSKFYKYIYIYINVYLIFNVIKNLYIQHTENTLSVGCGSMVRINVRTIAQFFSNLEADFRNSLIFEIGEYIGINYYCKQYFMRMLILEQTIQDEEYYYISGVNEYSSTKLRNIFYRNIKTMKENKKKQILLV
jgi:hypothetical protein